MSSILPDASVRDVERAILTGGGEGESGVVTAEDVQALRRVCIPVGREAAETLFDIAHATAAADNDPAFAEFFAETIGQYLLTAALATPERLRAFASALAAPSGSGASQWGDERHRRESAETERRLACAREIEAEDTKWAFAHLARGGALSPAEGRLLDLLRQGTGASFGQAA